MAFKGFFNVLKDGLQGEITKQIDKALNPSGSGGESSSSGGGFGAGGFKMDMNTLQGVLGLLGGKGTGGSGGNSKGGLGTVLDIIQGLQGQNGGILPGNVGKYLPQILKLAEVIGHGMGDDSPRTERNEDGSFIDDFVKTIIGGRKIFGGGGTDGKKSKPVRPKYDHTDSDGGSGQDYEALKNECLSQGALFEDPDFPAEASSVFFSKASRRFEWLRPHEICENPSFFVDGGSRFDVKQGELGDCWLLAAVANLTLNETLFHQVVPQDNSFEDGYAGIFHFRFWQYGEWVDVVVDDRLPTVGGKLMFMQSEDNNEMWSALFEKAYAKLHGSYEALKGGTTCEALEDLTGGVTEMYDIKSAPPNLLQMILKAFERSSFLGCSIEPDPHKVEAETKDGLIRGHAYSITGVKMLDIETPRVSGKVPLIKIRNPWGNEVEWKGAWSDCSPEWNYIDDDTKEEIGLVFDADGEFWMSFKDFMTHFERIEFCNLSPDSIIDGDESEGKKWKMDVFQGAWIEGQTAGGCRNNIETFANNPQYIIDLYDPDEGDGEEKCTVIVALMQKNRRAQMKHGIDCLTIGYAIYEIKDENAETPLPMQFFKYNASVARSPTFINLREVSCRFKLPPGRYVIVPSTFEPDEEGEFFIRVFTEEQA